MRYLLEQLGHEVVLLRKVLSNDASDDAVLSFACDAGWVLLNYAPTSWRRNRYSAKNPWRGARGIVSLA
ncbi:MAG: hypothetical protein JNL98_13435 [Bryobacterales bacterium]|nr:hypothetical protein [Bryobacterales bacterium]